MLQLTFGQSQLYKVNFCWPIYWDFLIQGGVWLHFGCIFEKGRDWRHSHKSLLLGTKVNHERLTFCWLSHVGLLITTFIRIHYGFNWILILTFKHSNSNSQNGGISILLLEKQVRKSIHILVKIQNFKYKLQCHYTAKWKLHEKIQVWPTIDFCSDSWPKSDPKPKFILELFPRHFQASSFIFKLIHYALAFMSLKFPSMAWTLA